MRRIHPFLEVFLFFALITTIYTVIHNRTYNPVSTFRDTSSNLSSEQNITGEMIPVSILGYSPKQTQFVSMKEGLQEIDRNKGDASCALPPPMQDVEQSNLIEIADRMTLMLVSGDFSRAYALFDAKLQTKFDKEDLQRAWKALKGETGEFLQRSSAATGECKGERYVYLTCRFEKTPLDIKVSFNERNQISGVSIEPALLNAPSATSDINKEKLIFKVFKSEGKYQFR